MLTDHDLRVRAIRRRARLDHLLYIFIFEAPCRWTKAGRDAHARWNRVWPRVRDECAIAAGVLTLVATMGVPYERCVEVHVEGCRCRRCPQTPPRRRSGR